jgi:hypothetical protein
MPYESCPVCGLRMYVVSGEACPRCGTPLGGVPRSPAAAVRADPQGPVERVLEVARRELRMDAALLTEVREGREVLLQFVDRGRFPVLAAGMSAPLDDTICRQLLDGAIDGVVHDAAHDPRVCDLPGVRQAGVGAYIGVLLDGAAAERYVLCCLAREARPDLDDSDLRFLRGLVESMRVAMRRAGGVS